MKNRKKELKNTVVLADAIGILVCVLVLTFAMRKEVADIKAETVVEKKTKKRGRPRKMKETTDTDESTFYVC